MSDEPVGIVCPICECAWTEVITTKKINRSRVRRYRKCHHCQKQFVTTETVHTIPPPKKKRPQKPKDDDDFFAIIDEND